MYELRDVAKIQAGADIIPSIMSNQVVPVVDVNPKHSRICNFMKSAALSNALAANLGTADNGKQTFLTGATVTAKFHTGGAATLVSLRLTSGGAARNIMNLVNFAGDGTTHGLSINFSCPIPVDAGTTISVTCDVAELATVAGASVYGFTVDNPSA